MGMGMGMGAGSARKCAVVSALPYHNRYRRSYNRDDDIISTISNHIDDRNVKIYNFLS